jgi:hypothetical protein
MIDRRAAGRWALLAAIPVLLGVFGVLVESREWFPVLRFAIERTPERAPSAVVVPPAERARGVSTVSLYVRPSDLTDPGTGIITRANRNKRGEDWERSGWVSFLENGRVVYSSGVGVRVHGGSSRLQERPQGFRLFFRKQYGNAHLPSEFAFGEAHAHPMRRLIIHNDYRDARKVRWHLVNPLAYDIAARVGSITSATRPVRFLLNGEFQGVFVLSEHFHPKHYFEEHWSHLVNLRVSEFEQLWRQVSAMRPMRLAEVSTLVDMENLTSWFIGVAFCATEDAYQGPAQYRDPSRDTAQWFFVSWDMDGSFRDPSRHAFASLLSRTGERRARRPTDPRPKILTTLLDQDADYRAYFMRRWTDALNHQLTPAFLQQRYEHYRVLGEQLGLTNRRDLAPLKRFLDERPAIVWQHAVEWLKTGPPLALEVSGGEAVVNGHRVGAGFHGLYFPGMRLTLEVPTDRQAAFSHWLVNGVALNRASLEFDIVEPLRVEAVYTAASTTP